MRVWLVVNPVAGSGKGERFGQAAAAALRARGIDVDVALTRHATHIFELADEASRQSFDGMVAVGGDGTFSSLVNALLKTGRPVPCPVGQLSLGTGNSLARDLGTKKFRAGIEAVAAGRTRPLDAIRYETPETVGYITNVMGIGFVSDVAARSVRYKRLGKRAYGLAVLLELWRPEHAETDIEIDGKRLALETTMIEVCNSRYTGGKMLIGPTAVLDDGLLDLVVVRRLNRRLLFAALTRVFSGTHVDMPGVDVLRGRKAEIVTRPRKMLSPDGEVFGYTPVKMECLRHCVEVFA